MSDVVNIPESFPIADSSLEYTPEDQTSYIVRRITGICMSVVRDPKRLSILTTLRISGKMTFSGLRRVLSTSSGNLISHLNLLAEKGFVSSSKGLQQGRVVSFYVITERGQSELRAYLESLTQILEYI